MIEVIAPESRAFKSTTSPTAATSCLPPYDFTTPSATMDVAHTHKQSNDLVYDISLLFWRVVTNIFFREIRPRGAFNIPRDGPVIFVAAPHNNQVR